MNPKAILTGLKNYNKDTDIPHDVLKAISKCKHNIPAPSKILTISDRYKETDGMVCGKCLCPQPTKTRQTIEKCECWK